MRDDGVRSGYLPGSDLDSQALASVRSDENVIEGHVLPVFGHGSEQAAFVQQMVLPIIEETTPAFDDLWAEDRSIYHILMDSAGIEDARSRLAHHLISLEAVLDSGYSGVPPLELVNAKECIKTFSSIISRRSEKLAGCSALKHLLRMAQDPDSEGVVSEGFVEEFKHIFRGINARSGIYDSSEPPAFIGLSGVRSAGLRSAALDRTARRVESYVSRYPHGLDHNIIRIRNANRNRILKRLGASETDWSSWKWQMRNVMLDAESLGALVELTDEEVEAIELATRHHIPFAVTPYYASLMDESPGLGRDAGVRSQVIPPLDYVHRMIAVRQKGGKSLDFMLERDTSPVKLITRRYPMIAVLKLTNFCSQICVYCQRNWEIMNPLGREVKSRSDAILHAVNWLRERPGIREVLVSGGDPLTLSEDVLCPILDELSGIDHIERIRIGTRTPVCLPQRLTQELAERLGNYNVPGRRELCVMTHFQYPYEITPESMDAIQKLRRAGISVYNQQVYTIYNSRRFESVALRRLLRLIGVDPYYMFNMKSKEETNQYRVPIARILQERKEEARLVPGTVRTDEPVYNIPKIGKNYLRAAQDHRLIMIRPNGRRVYEFDPWEKNMSPVPSFVRSDVSILDYLRKLAEIGEDVRDYATIWYYF